MAKKKPAESIKPEQRDTEIEHLIHADTIIKEISERVGIGTIEIIQGAYAKHAIIKGKRQNNPQHWIRIPLANCSTPIDAVNVVRSTLQKLVIRPFPVDALRECTRDLSDDVKGNEETLGATEGELLRKLAQDENGKMLIHAWYDFTKALNIPKSYFMEGDLRRISSVENEITNRSELGDQIVAYWWDVEGNTLHVVYASSTEKPSPEKHHEVANYPVLVEEIYTALQEMGINTIVKITNDDDEKNGALLTSTDDEIIYDTPFGSAPPILTTDVNGIVMDRVVLQTFINQIRDVLEWQKANGRQHGVNITIGDYILNESEDGDLNTCVHLDWHLKCYEQLPNISTELLEEEKSDILDCLLKDEELFEKIGIDILRAIKRSDTTTVRASQREIQYVEITWSLMHHYCTETEEIEELSRVLRSIHRESDETNLRIAILESFNIEETEDCIILRLGITVSDDDHE